MQQKKPAATKKARRNGLSAEGRNHLAFETIAHI